MFSLTLRAVHQTAPIWLHTLNAVMALIWSLWGALYYDSDTCDRFECMMTAMYFKYANLHAAQIMSRTSSTQYRTLRDTSEQQG